MVRPGPLKHITIGLLSFLVIELSVRSHLGHSTLIYHNLNIEFQFVSFLVTLLAHVNELNITKVAHEKKQN